MYLLLAHMPLWGDSYKIYVANADSQSVSVINGTTNKNVANIPLGMDPVDMVKAGNKIYVAGRGFISVINDITDTKEHDIPLGYMPTSMAIARHNPKEFRIL